MLKHFLAFLLRTVGWRQCCIHQALHPHELRMKRRSVRDSATFPLFIFVIFSRMYYRSPAISMRCGRDSNPSAPRPAAWKWLSPPPARSANGLGPTSMRPCNKGYIAPKTHVTHGTHSEVTWTSEEIGPCDTEASTRPTPGRSGKPVRVRRRLREAQYDAPRANRVRAR